MTAASYTPASSLDITLDEYLQKLVWQGASPVAAVASLARECREGYIELRPDIPAGTAILFEPDGHFYVETAAGPVSARDYICHKRSRFERVDYLHGLDQRAQFDGTVPAPPRAQAAPEDHLVPPEEQQPAAEGPPEAGMVPEDAPATSPNRDLGGKPPENNWEGAACYVDGQKPLPLKSDGSPHKQRAIDLMEAWFNKNEPPSPNPKTIRRWINANGERVRAWWTDK